MGLVQNFGAKVDKYSLVNVYMNLLSNGGQGLSLNLNQCLSYFNNLILSV